MPSYQTVVAPLRFTADPIKGSRFIADVFPVTTAAEAKEQLKLAQAHTEGATHHCWAYRLREGALVRSSDDGEPGGSAGRPILAQIEGHELFDVLVVVSRYYGGTKLGVGGLMRAYGGTAGKALDRAELLEVEQTVPLHIVFDYALTKPVEGVLRTQGLSPVHTAFEAEVRMLLEVAEGEVGPLKAALMESTSGRIKFGEG